MDGKIHVVERSFERTLGIRLLDRGLGFAGLTDPTDDAIKEAIKADKEAAETFGRMATHLDANGVDLLKTKATLGMVLKMDTKAEQFIGNDDANKLLKREYRKGFEVPELA